MARKNVLLHQIVTAQSMSTDFISPPTVILYTDNISYQINCITTDSIGTFSLEVSNDFKSDPVTGVIQNPGIWNPLSLGASSSSPTIPTVTANDTIIDISLNQVPFNAIRVAYTSDTPGTGVCDIYILTKQLGG